MEKWDQNCGFLHMSYINIKYFERCAWIYITYQNGNLTDVTKYVEISLMGSFVTLFKQYHYNTYILCFMMFFLNFLIVI